MANKDIPLPEDMRLRWGHLAHLRCIGIGQWASECPNCGSSGHDSGSGLPDRFHIHAADSQYNARGKCRRCGHFEWVDQGEPQSFDPLRIQQQEELRRIAAAEEQRRLRERLDELRDREYWRGYHDAMRENHRALWRQAGIPDEFQDYWQLGFKARYSEEIPSPALTIPYFDPGWEATNLQFRLTNPPRPNDKYRFSSGLKPGLWLTNPDESPSGPCLVLEGMKKAGVVYLRLAARTDSRLCVVAVPSKTPSDEMLNRLTGCDPIYLALDPDAYIGRRGKDGRQTKSEAARVADKLGKERVRMVNLPAKADDLFLDYQFTPDMFMNYVRQATRPLA